VTKAEKLLASYLLEIASDQFSNHGCNDFMKEDYRDLTEEDVMEITKGYDQWNNASGDPDQNHDRPYQLPDFALMSYLADALLDEAEKP
jgi:hypothetical protein